MLLDPVLGFESCENNIKVFFFRLVHLRVNALN